MKLLYCWYNYYYYYYYVNVAKTLSTTFLLSGML